MAEMAPISGSGFDTAVLTQKNEAKPSAGGVSPFPETAQKGGLFLISNANADPESNPKTKNKSKGKDSGWARSKKTTNRKHKTFDDVFPHKGENYRVNPGKQGLYVEILKRMIDQFELACQKWGRVFVLRFDLHQHVYIDDNHRITAFRKLLFKRLKYKYGFQEIGFCWAREQEKAKAQHYHFVLFLDGRLVRHSSKINQLITAAWDDGTGSYHVPVIKRPFYFGSHNEIAGDVIHRISYLAKVRGKGYRDKQAKDYQCSRMRP